MDRPVTEGGGGGMTKNLIPKKSALRKEGLERVEPLNNVDSPLLSAAFSLSLSLSHKHVSLVREQDGTILPGFGTRTW